MPEETIEIFKHIANSFLISEVIKNDLVDTFVNNFSKLLKVDKNVIDNINSIFSEEEYIYFPKPKNQDIIYCFRYGEDKFQYGGLNIAKRTDFHYEENTKFSLSKAFSSLTIKKDIKEQIGNYLIKIENFNRKLNEIDYNIDAKWLMEPLENLKHDAIKYQNRIIIKIKYGFLGDYDKVIYNEEKISVKALNALLEGNQRIQTIYKEDNVMNSIITKYQNSNENFKFGYRIMVFYDFDLFADHQAITMKLIMETIYNILNSDFNYYFKPIEGEINNILQKNFKEFIDLVLSTESPEFEKTNILRFFSILFNSFLKKFKQLYQKLQNNLESDKKELLKLFNIIEKNVSEKINAEISDYQNKMKIFNNNNNKYNKDLKENANRYYQNKSFLNKGKYFIKGLGKIDTIKIYQSSADFINFEKKYHTFQKPRKDTNWETNLKRIQNIKNNLEDIKNRDDINKNIEEISKLQKYIEKNDLEKFYDLSKRINESFDIFNKIQFKSNDYLTKEIKLDLKKTYYLKNNDLYLIYRIIRNFDNNIFYNTLFKIEKISVRKNFSVSYNICTNKFINQRANFIFSKSDNNPAFLNKKKCLGIPLNSCNFSNF